MIESRGGAPISAFFRLQAALAILVYLKYEFIPKIARLAW
jgi:hypothetical protein